MSRLFAAYMNSTAEETKTRALHEVVKESTMDNFILTYGPLKDNTHSKIKAIKAVRMILGTGLKDAKNIVEGTGRFEHGIIVSRLQSYAINAVYVQAFACSETIEGERFHDFTFERIPKVLYREDFTGEVPIGDLSKPPVFRDVSPNALAKPASAS